MGSQILGQAARLVVPGGQLTYATCTVFAEENERVVARFLDSEAGAPFELVFERASRALGDPTVQVPVPDAHFVAVFRRIR